MMASYFDDSIKRLARYKYLKNNQGYAQQRNSWEINYGRHLGAMMNDVGLNDSTDIGFQSYSMQQSFLMPHIYKTLP